MIIGDESVLKRGEKMTTYASNPWAIPKDRKKEMLDAGFALGLSRDEVERLSIRKKWDLLGGMPVQNGKKVNAPEPDLLPRALNLIRAGVSVVPCTRETKLPYFKVLPKDPDSDRATWNPYKETIADDETVQRWFGPADAIAIVGGAVSGGLEILDFDSPALFGPWRELVDSIAPGLYDQLPVQRTQSGGYHVCYRCATIEGNQKLAEEWVAGDDGQPKKTTLIETRGEGGYALVHPSEGYEMVQGDLESIPTITKEDRQILLASTRAFSKVADEHPKDHNSSPVDGSISRSGDAFNEQGDIMPVLEKAGWEVVFEKNEAVYLRRPGKNRGVSATWNYVPRRFYTFSTNAHAFEPEKAYQPFAVYAILEHSGDFAAAAKELAGLGYGDQTEPTYAENRSRTGKTETPKGEAKIAIPGKVPNLPEYARLTPEQKTQATTAGKWLDDYIAFASKASPLTPTSFHEAAGLFSGSLAIARRIHLPVSVKRNWIRPNLYVLFESG